MITDERYKEIPTNLRTAMKRLLRFGREWSIRNYNEFESIEEGLVSIALYDNDTTFTVVIEDGDPLVYHLDIDISGEYVKAYEEITEEQVYENIEEYFLNSV